MNGMSKKLNPNIKKIIFHIFTKHSTIDDYFNCYSIIYNSSFHSEIQDKPSYLYLVYEPLLPTDFLNTSKLEKHSTINNFVEDKTTQV